MIKGCWSTKKYFYCVYHKIILFLKSQIQQFVVLKTQGGQGRLKMTANDTNSHFNQTIVIIFATISIICSILIFITFIYLREVRTLTRQIIICITLADFFTALANLCGVLVIGTQFEGEKVENQLSLSWCSIQSFVSSTSSLCSFLWTMVLSVALYQVLINENFDRFVRLLPLFHIICWLLPLVINITALVLGKLGYYLNTYGTGGWCWIGLLLFIFLFISRNYLLEVY